jgi:murein tripeptide amidase MpaA
MIKMSEFEETDSRLSLPLYKRKKYAIISARVHPGESNGSYMMQGLIKYLLGESHQAKELRKRIVFKIIPMSNPDGVVIGNYRTSMVGHDLNRRYHEPDFRLHPTIVAIK